VQFCGLFLISKDQLVTQNEPKNNGRPAYIQNRYHVFITAILVSDMPISA